MEKEITLNVGISESVEENSQQSVEYVKPQLTTKKDNSLFMTSTNATENRLFMELAELSYKNSLQNAPSFVEPALYTDSSNKKKRSVHQRARIFKRLN